MYTSRIAFVQALILVVFILIIGRLFYWQVLSGSKLQAIATIQHQSTVLIPADRGEIYSSDGFPLATNEPSYLVFAYTPDLEESPLVIADALKELIAPTPQEIDATDSADIRLELVQNTYESIREKLTEPKLSWIPLRRHVNQEVRDAIESLGFNGIGFETHQVRHYPEASMAAQLLGFVGSDGTGNPKGYFGLEGKYDLELTGKPGQIRQERDAFGRPIVIGEYQSVAGRDGRSLKTHINRSVQRLVERHLKDGVERYGAVSGEVVIMDPYTGGIIAMAAEPKFDPRDHRKFDQDTYRAPAVASSYEPGSTFKTIVMASALDAGVITPEMVCNQVCNGPVQIGRFTIRTWNDEYNPGQDMTEVLRRSDNVGMIFVARQLGVDRFTQYLNDFGFGAKTGIDLEGEINTRLRDRWGDIDLATGSFGQGIAVTSVQMVSAISAIANGGLLMQPHVVSEVHTDRGVVEIEPKVIRRVISSEAADAARQMMIVSGQTGEAQWAVPEGYNIAGKTGTAQIPIDGHYDRDKTIASFIGFAPGHDPRYVMVVKLRETTSSPWAAETAAPLWFDITKDLFTHLDVHPE